MNKVSIGLAVAVALILVTFSIVGRAAAPTPEPPHLVSMAESGRAMRQAGTAMQAHAQTMVDQGRRAGDQSLVAYGERWQRDGQDMVRRGQEMEANPTAPGSLHATRGDLEAQASWDELSRTAQAMLHDPGRARAADLEALRWSGLAMRSEGENMAEHGQLMADEIALMVAQHKLDAAVEAGLRQAAETLRAVGGHLQQNGQAMVNYADRLRRSMGFR